MGITIANATRSAGADSMVNRVDAGAGPGVIRVYTGPRPAGPDTPVATQTLLGEWTLADPAFAAAAAGSKALDADPVLTTTGLAAGTAAWFRALDSDDVAVLDGSVTATGGDGDLQINTTAVSVGLELQITGGSMTMPAGTP